MGTLTLIQLYELQLNIILIQPKDEIEDLLLSITKKCERLIDQTHRKAEETLEFKMIKPREILHFKPSIQVKGDWMLGLVDLEVYNPVFNITKKITNSNFINFLIKMLVVFHTKKSELRLKETWIFQILQLPIYKMI